jgi:tetratricopeptide (TPR) repeat protein
MNRRLALLIVVACLWFGAAVQAQSLLRPLPDADLSRLSPSARHELEAARREFDKTRQGLLGEPLATAYAQVGAYYARYGYYDVARAALENALALAPNDGRFHYLKGVFEGQSNRLSEAHGAFTRALELEPNYLPIRYRLATTQLALNDVAGAKRTIEAVLAQRTDLAPAHYIAGQIALRERRHTDAIAALRATLTIDPSASAVYASLAQALEAGGDRAGAAAARAKVGPVEPVYADPLVQNIFAAAPQEPAAQALALAARDQHAQARLLLDAELENRPNDVALLATYARVEADAGNRAAAASRADAALKLDPNGATGNLTRGIVWEMAGRDNEAVAHYERALRADPNLAEARLLLGNSQLRRRQYAQATEHYRQLLKLDPDDGLARLRLAAAQSASGRCAEGLAEVNQGLRSRPRDGALMQAFVRVAATCASVSAEERQMAVDYGQALYKQRPDEAHSEALAMALAATAKRQEAIDFQAQAMFEALKRGDQAAVDRLKPQLERYKTGARPTQPWLPGDPVLEPPPLQ